MSDGMNKVILVGNLGADPELKVIGNGQAMCKMKVATTETWTGNNGRQEHTEWHQVVVWGKTGEACAANLGKGSRVLVEGSINTRVYEKDGSKRYATEIKAHKVMFLGGHGQRSGAPRNGGGGERRQRRAAPTRVNQADFEYPQEEGQGEMPEPDGF